MKLTIVVVDFFFLSSASDSLVAGAEIPLYASRTSTGIV
jgi:hypothetical protein